MMAEESKTDDVRPAAGHGLGFEGSTGYLLARTGAVARRRWARMLAEQGLTPHQFGMLVALDQLGPAGQQRVSEIIGIDPRNAVPVIDGLVDRGMLVRQEDAADRRRRTLILTRSGHEMVRELNVTGAQIEKQFLRALAPAEQLELHRLLLSLWSSAAEEDSDSPRGTSKGD